VGLARFRFVGLCDAGDWRWAAIEKWRPPPCASRIPGKPQLIAGGTGLALAGRGVIRCSREIRRQALRVQEARACSLGVAPTGERASRAVPRVHARALQEASSQVRRARAQRLPFVRRFTRRLLQDPMSTVSARNVRRFFVRGANGLQQLLGKAHCRAECDHQAPSPRATAPRPGPGLAREPRLPTFRGLFCSEGRSASKCCSAPAATSP
jgi:hypothetical protein